jgi:hypothetical protein
MSTAAFPSCGCTSSESIGISLALRTQVGLTVNGTRRSLLPWAHSDIKMLLAILSARFSDNWPSAISPQRYLLQFGSRTGRLAEAAQYIRLLVHRHVCLYFRYGRRDPLLILAFVSKHTFKEIKCHQGIGTLFVKGHLKPGLSLMENDFQVDSVPSLSF